MSSVEKYMKLFRQGCDLSEDLIRFDGEQQKELGFFDRRRLKKARSVFEASATECPQNAAPYLMLAKVSFSLGEHSESLDFLKKAWSLEPDNLILVIELSSTYSEMGEYQEAISVLEEGIKLFPNEPRVLSNLGRCYLFVNKPMMAVEVFQKVVAIEPDYADNLLLLNYAKDILSGSKPAPSNNRDITSNI